MKSALVIGDDLKTLKPDWDTSLYFSRRLLGQGWHVDWARAKDMAWVGHDPFVRGTQLKIFERGSVPPQGMKKRCRIADYDLILVRKDPPFDHDYLRLCWLLATVERETKISNLPSLLTRYHEKLLPWEALHQGFLSQKDLMPFCAAQESEWGQKFVKNYPSRHYVTKPWLGYQGHQVNTLSSSEAKRFDWEHLQEDQILQPLIESIATVGDRRAFFAKGRFLGSFVRIPAKGSIVSNIARGGTAVDRPLSRTEQKLIAKVEKFLKAINVDFAGADLIDGKLNEINITSPTGLGVYEDLFEVDLSAQILKEILR